MHIFKSRSGHVVALLSIVAALSYGAADDQPAASPSLRSDVPFNEHVKRTFDRRSGLPSSWINDVIQTRDDYVWLATDNGVTRYDGFNFKVFNPANTPQLPFNETRVLYEGRDGSLWIGTTGGLTQYKPGRPGTFEEVPTLTDIRPKSNVHLWNFVYPIAGSCSRSLSLRLETVSRNIHQERTT